MNSQTGAALAQAYGVFAHYKDEYNFARHSGVVHSLRDLTREDWVAMDSECDMGVQIYSDESADLLRHFLPRFLEWVSYGPASHPFELWDLGYRLDWAKWREWPVEEVEALRGVFLAWAQELLTDEEAGLPMEFLIVVEDDLTPYLKVWLQARPHELAAWLTRLDWQNHQNVWEWALSIHVEEKLETAFFRCSDGERGKILARAVDLIHSLRG